MSKKIPAKHCRIEIRGIEKKNMNEVRSIVGFSILSTIYLIKKNNDNYYLLTYTCY